MPTPRWTPKALEVPASWAFCFAWVTSRSSAPCEQRLLREHGRWRLGARGRGRSRRLRRWQYRFPEEAKHWFPGLPSHDGSDGDVEFVCDSQHQPWCLPILLVAIRGMTDSE